MYVYVHIYVDLSEFIENFFYTSQVMSKLPSVNQQVLNLYGQKVLQQIVYIKFRSPSSKAPGTGYKTKMKGLVREIIKT